MSLLDTLRAQPIRTTAQGRIETPLGPWPEPVSAAKSEAQRQRAIEAAKHRKGKRK